jgi:hypothetical protein
MRKDNRSNAVRFDASYQEIGRIGDPCAYCGVESDVYDHVPPLHYVSRLAENDLNGSNLRKIPACTECNTALNGLILITLKDRRKRIKEYLRKKYRSFLAMPKWDEDELAELEPKFADEIRRASRYAEFIKTRVGFY